MNNLHTGCTKVLCAIGGFLIKYEFVLPIDKFGALKRASFLGWDVLRRFSQRNRPPEQSPPLYGGGKRHTPAEFSPHHRHPLSRQSWPLESRHLGGRLPGHCPSYAARWSSPVGSGPAMTAGSRSLAST